MKPADVGGGLAGGREPVMSTVAGGRRVGSREKERRDSAVERNG